MMNGRELVEIAKDEMIWRDKIRDILRQGPRSVPEVARLLKKPSPEVMYWMMSLRKYCRIVESEEPNDEGFYEYRWIGEDS
jgi:hypothetical protein